MRALFDDLPLFRWAAAVAAGEPETWPPPALEPPFASRRFKPAPPPADTIWAPRVLEGIDLGLLALSRALKPVVPACPIVSAIRAAPGVKRHIGVPETEATDDAHAWVEVDRSGFLPVVKIWFRGVKIAGDRIKRDIDQATGSVVKVDLSGDVRSDFSLDALREAMDEARKALRQAGVQLSALAEVRQPPAFKGAVALIGLRTPVDHDDPPPPVRAPFRARESVAIMAA